MKGPLFPVWQIDLHEYREVCAYLDLPPKTHLYNRLSADLARAPFRFERPKGFSLFLAKPRLTKFRIARLDLASKLLFRNHPARHVLNAVVALHECDGESYERMAAVPTGWSVPVSLLGWGIRFVLSFFVTLIWLCGQFLLFLGSTPLRPRDDLTGKRILITGVNGGLGGELLGYSLQQGAEVVGTVRSPEMLADVASRLPSEAPARFVDADLSRPGAFVKALQKKQVDANSIDIAVLCAGVKHSGRSVLSERFLRETFEVNYFSCVEFADWLFQPGRETTLVLISSMGRWHGMHSTCGYNASKAALSIWGESLEMELHRSGKRDCRIMIVEPGIFESGMIERRGLRKFLVASRRHLAAQVFSGALAGRRALRYPFWFALVTWAVCLGGRGLRQRVFARVNEQR